ncbi:hypothetical protein [Endothiovibrio diazotrophicus]
MIKQYWNSAVAADLREFVGDIGDWAHDNVSRLRGRDRKAFTSRFVAWSRQCFADRELAAWIAELDDGSQTLLGERLEHFCRDFGLDLARALDGPLSADEPLAQALLQVAENYCRASRHAAECSD